MRYLANRYHESFVVGIETEDEMNRLYEWDVIKNGFYDQTWRTTIMPWDRQFDLESYIQPDFKNWLETHAHNENGMPLFALRWENGYYDNAQYYTWRLFIHFYRERAAALFRLTFE